MGAVPLPSGVEPLTSAVRKSTCHHHRHAAARAQQDRPSSPRSCLARAVLVDAVVILGQLLLLSNHLRRQLNAAHCSSAGDADADADPSSSPLPHPGALASFPCAAPLAGRLAFLATRSNSLMRAALQLPAGELWLPLVMSAALGHLIAALVLPRNFYLNHVRRPCMVVVGVLPKAASLVAFVAFPGAPPSSYFTTYLPVEGAIMLWHQLMCKFPFWQGVAVLAAHCGLTTALCLAAGLRAAQLYVPARPSAGGIAATAPSSAYVDASPTFPFNVAWVLAHTYTCAVLAILIMPQQQDNAPVARNQKQMVSGSGEHTPAATLTPPLGSSDEQPVWSTAGDAKTAVRPWDSSGKWSEDIGGGGVRPRLLSSAPAAGRGPGLSGVVSAQKALSGSRSSSNSFDDCRDDALVNARLVQAVRKLLDRDQGATPAALSAAGSLLSPSSTSGLHSEASSTSTSGKCVSSVRVAQAISQGQARGNGLYELDRLQASLPAAPAVVVAAAQHAGAAAGRASLAGEVPCAGVRGVAAVLGFPVQSRSGVQQAHLMSQSPVALAVPIEGMGPMPMPMMQQQQQQQQQPTMQVTAAMQVQVAAPAPMPAPLAPGGAMPVAMAPPPPPRRAAALPPSGAFSLKQPTGLSKWTIMEDQEFRAPAATVAIGVSSSLEAISLMSSSSRRFRRYQSRAAPQRVHMKIPWAEPDQLPSNFLERLNVALSEGLDCMAVGVAARAGCIELVFDVVPQAAFDSASDRSPSLAFRNHHRRRQLQHQQTPSHGMQQLMIEQHWLAEEATSRQLRPPTDGGISAFLDSATTTATAAGGDPRVAHSHAPLPVAALLERLWAASQEYHQSESELALMRLGSAGEEAGGWAGTMLPGGGREEDRAGRLMDTNSALEDAVLSGLMLTDAEPASWIDALHLQPPPGAEVLTQACGRVWISRWDHTRRQWVPEKAGGIRPSQLPRITHLHPPCILLHPLQQQQQPQQQQAAEGGAAPALCPSPPLVATASAPHSQLRLTVCNADNVPSFSARCRGRYLPVEVKDVRWIEAASDESSSGDLSAGSAAASDDSAFQLGRLRCSRGPAEVVLELPAGLPRNGLVIIECKVGKLVSNWRPVIVTEDPLLADDLATLATGAPGSGPHSPAPSDSGTGSAATAADPYNWDELLSDLGLWLDYLEVLGLHVDAEGGRRGGGRTTSRSGSVPGAPQVPEGGSIGSQEGACGGAGGGGGWEGLEGDPLARLPGSLDFGNALAGLYGTARYRAHMTGIAVSLLEFAVDRGWTHTANLLVRQARAAGIAWSELLARCNDGLTLLHRAVRSAVGEMVQLVVELGEQNGTPFDWKAVSSTCHLVDGTADGDATAVGGGAEDGATNGAGVTPLHLAATLPDGGRLAERILSEYQAACELWVSALDGHGLRPVDCARASGHVHLTEPQSWDWAVGGGGAAGVGISAGAGTGAGAAPGAGAGAGAGFYGLADVAMKECDGVPGWVARAPEGGAAERGVGGGPAAAMTVAALSPAGVQEAAGAGSASTACSVESGITGGSGSGGGSVCCGGRRDGVKPGTAGSAGVGSHIGGRGAGGGSGGRGLLRALGPVLVAPFVNDRRSEAMYVEAVGAAVVLRSCCYLVYQMSMVAAVGGRMVKELRVHEMTGMLIFFAPHAASALLLCVNYALWLRSRERLVVAVTITRTLAKLLPVLGLLPYPSSATKYMPWGMDVLCEGILPAVFENMRAPLALPMRAIEGVTTGLLYHKLGIVRCLPWALTYALAWALVCGFITAVMDARHRAQLGPHLARRAGSPTAAAVTPAGRGGGGVVRGG